jgi:sodium/bile acid cotransporter 7
MIARIFHDRFVPMLFAAIALASLLPVRGDGVAAAQAVATAAVVLLFFLNGVRLPRHAVLGALRNLRLMGAALLFCFAAMPALGLALYWATEPLLPHLVALGFLYCGILPSTVQSATGATGMANGDVAASVVLAALLNMVGVILSPLLFALLDRRAAQFNSDAELRIILILLLPFCAGQLARRWLAAAVTARPALVRTLDRSAILIAVYVAFSGAIVGGLGDRLSGGDLAVIAVGTAIFLAAAYAGAWALGGMCALALPQRASLMFAGAQKSIAVGAPLAAMLFPPATAGMVLVVILGYHMAQLIVAAWLAPRIAAQIDAKESVLVE